LHPEKLKLKRVGRTKKKKKKKKGWASIDAFGKGKERREESILLAPVEL